MKMNSFENFNQPLERFKGIAEKSMLIFLLTLATMSESEAQKSGSGPSNPVIPQTEMNKEANNPYNIPVGEVRGYRLGRTTNDVEVVEVKDAPVGGNAPHIHKREDESDRTDINDALRSWNEKKNATKEAPAYKIPLEIKKEKHSDETKKYFGPGNGPQNKNLNPEDVIDS